mgnify:CR=1 FL=1
MKENLSRRDALKVLWAASAALWGGVTLIAAKRLYPFTSLLELGEVEEVKPEELQIVTSGEIETEGETARINKTAISEAVLYAAKIEDPMYGQVKVRELFERGPLEVEIIPEITRPHYYQGQPYYPLAYYTPYLFRGPKITFNGSFIEVYHQSLKNMDLGSQVVNDGVGYHEIYHLLQDIKNPIGHIITTAVKDIRERANIFSFLPQFEIWNEDVEVEAQKKAAMTTHRIFSQYIQSVSSTSWPFGRFFNFS